MTPNATLFTKTRNRWRYFMQLRSNPDFMHGDFEMFSRVWRSIESLCLTSGLRKNYAREVGIRSVPQYQISPIFSSGAYLGEVELEKSTITLKYATDAERICKFSKYHFFVPIFLQIFVKWHFLVEYRKNLAIGRNFQFWCITFRRPRFFGKGPEIGVGSRKNSY